MANQSSFAGGTLAADDAASQAYVPPNSHLVFHDEFDGNTLNRDVWSTGNSRTLSGNGEKEFYMDPEYQGLGFDPFQVHDGVLTIEAKPTESWLLPYTDGLPYTSGEITTASSHDWTYGYFEMRAQLPEGHGLWPAFWLVNRDIWPPEIDVLEAFGDRPTDVHYGVHTRDNGGDSGYGDWHGVDTDTTAGYHTYGVDWQPDKITFYFDGKPYASGETYSDSHMPMFLIANLAVGGDWPGVPDETTPFPAHMNIDYIRVYQDGPGEGTGGGEPGGQNNHAPEAAADTATTAQDTPVIIPVLANDGDADGDTLAIVGTGDAQHGTVAANPDGTVTYTPAAGYHGDDAFSYTVGDGHDGTATADVGITVTGSSDPGPNPDPGPGANQPLVGTGGDDVLTGGNGDDAIRGRAGNDVLWGDGQPQTVTDPYTVKITASGDQYNGTPEMQVYVDDKLVGDVEVTGAHKSGEWQDYTFTADGVADAHTVKVVFVNDAFSGSGTNDRNLWVGGIAVNGAALAPEDATYQRADGTELAGRQLLPWNGALAFDVSGHPAATHQDDHHDGVLWTGNDVLNGGSGDDTLNGGPGADNFAFKPGSGHDVIKDFEAGVDHIDLYGYAPSDVQLRAANGNEVIDLGGGNDITLEHVAPNQVAVNDLLFH